MTEPTSDKATSTLFPTFQKLFDRYLAKPGTIDQETANSSLPESLKNVSKQFVAKSRWRKRSSAALTKTILDYFSNQIECGVTEEALVAQWSDIVPLPHLRKLQDPSLFAIHSLPPAVAERIVSVVRRTRLWRHEQIDVARELISHFQDGIDSGVPAEELVEQFGDPDAAARLIGRAKRRNRSWLWQATARLMQFAGVMILILAVWWIYLLIRFQFAKPHVVHDYIGQLDARSLALGVDDRAWSFYAQALIKFTDSGSFSLTADQEAKLVPEWAGLLKRVDVQREGNRIVGIWPVDADRAGAPAGTENVQREFQLDMAVYSKALDELSGGEHWPALVQLAEMNQETIQLILQGAKKPSLGFVYRDPENSGWLAATRSLPYDDFEKRTRSILEGVLIPHMQYVRTFERLLRLEAERTRLAGERQRVMEIIVALMNIGVQIDHADGFAVEKMIGRSFALRSWMILRKILSDQPELFTDADLQTAAHQIVSYRSFVDLRFPLGTRQFCDDFLQRLYSDDGHGNGQLTAEGWRLLNDAIPNAHLRGQHSDAYMQLEGSLISGVVASRAEMRQLFDQLLELEEREWKQSLSETNLEANSAANELMLKILSTISGQLKYGPLQPLSPFGPDNSIKASNFVLAGESAMMRSDATQVALALELYRRRNGEWPSGLQQLCPDLLPSVPLDRFDGKPMKYRMIDGKPVVYSVGRNRIDDGGSWSDESKPSHDLKEGDWRLWPVWPADD